MKRSFSIRGLAVVLFARAIAHITQAQTATIASRPAQKVIGYQIGDSAVFLKTQSFFSCP